MAAGDRDDLGPRHESQRGQLHAPREARPDDPDASHGVAPARHGSESAKMGTPRNSARTSGRWPTLGSSPDPVTVPRSTPPSRTRRIIPLSMANATGRSSARK